MEIKSDGHHQQQQQQQSHAKWPFFRAQCKRTAFIENIN